MESDMTELRVDRTALSVVPRDDSDDNLYWRSRSPEERLEAIEVNRQIVYGYGPVAPRMEKVLEIVQR
jgi:hypothetical protein